MAKKSNKKIVSNKEVKAYYYGDTLELTTAVGNKGRKYLPYSDTEYITLDGEIKEYKKSVNKSDNLGSVKKTMKRLRRLIANNFEGGQNQLWLTLTYKINMRDVARLSSDLRQFLKKLRRKYGALEYIAVMEPQKRGAWHYHILLKTDDGRPLYIHNDVIYKLWKHGFTKTKRLSESDNVAAYVMAYLTDMDVNEDDDTKKSKKIIKGMRLNFYPSNMQIYRCSRGIKAPEVENGSKSKILDKYLSQYFNDSMETNLIEPNFYGERHLKGILKNGKDLKVETEFYNLSTYGGDDRVE
ncbi:rolling circle replication-associated protein [Staphylococcus capitis]|uniref:rolling circle replication-associated protein n=1 Tax=Staphylococcus capitis TaxID=29388 RepID=UPI003CEF59BF